MRQVRMEVEGADVVEQPWAVEVADGGQRRDFPGAFDDGGSQPPNVVNGHVECPHQRAGVLAEALLARYQAVAVVFVLHLALAVVVGEADVVVGRQKQTGALSLSHSVIAAISSGAASWAPSRWSRPNTMSVSVSASTRSSIGSL